MILLFICLSRLAEFGHSYCGNGGIGLDNTTMMAILLIFNFNSDGLKGIQTFSVMHGTIVLWPWVLSRFVLSPIHGSLGSFQVCFTPRVVVWDFQLTSLLQSASGYGSEACWCIIAASSNVYTLVISYGLCSMSWLYSCLLWRCHLWVLCVIVFYLMSYNL